MQLTVNILSKTSPDFLNELLSTINTCKCMVMEIRLSQLINHIACYMLIDGNWNHIAKLETFLETLDNQTDLDILKYRIDETPGNNASMPYTLETISLENKAMLFHLCTFLAKRNIQINEMTASNYPASYLQTSVFSSKLIIFIPPDISLLSFREELLDFCDQLNIDAILEPVKR